MRSLFALFAFAGCAPVLRSVSSSEPPRRFSLAAPEPSSVHRVLGVDLAVHDSEPGSTKPTIVCLHAIGHGGGDYAQLEASLVSDYRVVIVDWPGHGHSGPDSEPASAARYATLLSALVDSMGLDRFAIIGNSIGGAAAIRYAAAQPHRVRALVLANPGGLDPGGFIAKLFIGSLVRRFEQGVRSEARFEAWFRDYYAYILVTEASRAQRDRIVVAGYESAPLLREAWSSFAQPEANLERFVPRVTAPVLLTWAKRDRLVSWDRNRAAIERFPNARVEFFDAGHSAFLEQPEAFLTSLEQFLGSLK